MRQKEKNIQYEMKAGVVKNYVPVGLSMAVEQSMVQDGTAGVRLSMGTASQRMSNSINPMALKNNKTGALEDRIHSDCINLGTMSQEQSQDGIRRSTKSAGRVRAYINTKKGRDNDEILTFENDFDPQ